MKLFSRNKDGRLRHIYIFGHKVFTYKTSRSQKIFTLPGNTIKNIPAGCKITVYGSGNSIVFHPPFGKGFVGSISIGTPDCPADNCRIDIGPECTANGLEIFIMEHASLLSIGQDCMFSADVKIWLSDTHAITDSSGNLVNRGHSVTLGRHVWVGYGASILKNTSIPDGTIVGTKSVVAGNKWNPNAVIAGNPAREMRQGVYWHRERPNDFL